jgi:tetratricopeptide (TPR) repeat protein
MEQTVAPTSPRRKADPVVKWLSLAIAGVIIFWLVSMFSAMMFGVIMPPKLPRTAAEHDLTVLGAQVDSGKVDTQTYAQYIDALIRAGQLSKAQSALDQSLKVAKTDKSYLLGEQAQLLLVRKEYRDAVTFADKAMSTAQAELEAFMDKNEQNSRQREAGAVMPTSYTSAALVKAASYVASEDYKRAIEAYDAYLKYQPADSDILVSRADAKAKTGDKKGAEKDFREALRYVPDYQPALDGLREIGVTQ